MNVRYHDINVRHHDKNAKTSTHDPRNAEKDVRCHDNDVRRDDVIVSLTPLGHNSSNGITAFYTVRFVFALRSLLGLPEWPFPSECLDHGTEKLWFSISNSCELGQ